MLRGIDHVAVVVADLDAAIATYTGLGFTVVHGGRHPNGSHNAFMSFANGSVLELFGFLDVTQPNEHRYWNDLQQGGEGLVDFCMSTDDLPSDLARFRSAGLELNDPIDRSRTRPDGVELRWRVAITRPGCRRVVPFLIEDITPRSQRIPPPTPHENGCRGITEIEICAGSLELPRAVGAAIGESATESGDGLAIMVGEQRLRWRVAETMRGPGPVGLILDAGPRGPTEIDPALAHGVDLRFCAPT